MGPRVGTLGVFAALAGVTASAQPYRLGRVLSTEFLTRLVQQRLLPAQVAIINASVGSVMILHRNASGPAVFIDGAGNGVQYQIAEQLSDSVAQEEPLHLKIEHRSIEVASCPAMTERIGEFLRQLDAFVPSSSDRVSTSTPQEIIVDATDYRIITLGSDALLTIQPNGSLDPPLQQSAGQLHSAVSRCAGSVIPQVQRHDFYQ